MARRSRGLCQSVAEGEMDSVLTVSVEFSQLGSIK